MGIPAAVGIALRLLVLSSLLLLHASFFLSRSRFFLSLKLRLALSLLSGLLSFGKRSSSLLALDFGFGQISPKPSARIIQLIDHRRKRLEFTKVLIKDSVKKINARNEVQKTIRREDEVNERRAVSLNFIQLF